MDRDSLKAWLGAGLSLREIGELTGRDASTVGYWVKKHGLQANGAARYAPRGGIDRDRLTELVERQGTLKSIAEELGVSQSTVSHWMRRFGLKTARRHRTKSVAQATAAGQTRFLDHCHRHGETEFAIYGDGRSRCLRCNREFVSSRRRRIKATLVAEAGGRCLICGYDRDPAALQFHHLDPSSKKFGLGSRGATRALARARDEAAKCVLLCANCHAEVESGTTRLSVSSASGRGIRRTSE